MKRADELFAIEGRSSRSPFVDETWWTRSEPEDSFISVAASHWQMCVTRQRGSASLTVRGPQTKATITPIPEDAEFFGIQFGTTAFDESHRFVTEGLGMRQTDWVETEIAAGIELEIRFYHCNPRHHSLALARAPFDLPQRLHHFMVEVADRDDVGYAFDRAWNAGCAIASGLGHHPNDQMFSFYVESPVGFQVEVGHGARLVTEGWDGNRGHDRISTWGHQPLSAR